jgi:hypothetical protein
MYAVIVIPLDTQHKEYVDSFHISRGLAMKRKNFLIRHLTPGISNPDNPTFGFIPVIKVKEWTTTIPH